MTKAFNDSSLKPNPPLGRLLREGGTGVCPLCKSSLKPFYIFKKGCIQPLCDNYWDKKNKIPLDKLPTT